MEIQTRLLKFVTLSNWVILCLAGLVGLMVAPPAFVRGIVCGGLIVTINFHLLYRTLKKALTPPHLASHNAVLAKYYVRFAVSGLLIFALIATRFVNPLGLVVGLSIVVASIMLAAACEVKRMIFKEAV